MSAVYTPPIPDFLRELTGTDDPYEANFSLGAIGCLIAMFKQEHDWDEDEDPSATDEMLTECESLLRGLRRPIRDALEGQLVLGGYVEAAELQRLVDDGCPIADIAEVAEFEIPF